MTDNHPTYRFGNDFDEKLSSFVDNFIADGFNEFESEFGRIDDFVKAALCDPSHEEHNMRRTPKAKYLLEMVAFKIYDELNREAFNNKKNTLIIMPDCLSIHEKHCEKVEYAHGSICRKCQPECQAYAIVDLAKKYGAKVFFSKRKLTEQLEHHGDKMGDIGVIGIACVMMLASGMRTAHEIDVPARGVLLNFTGCEHWNDKPFASAFNLDQLENILREKHGNKD